MLGRFADQFFAKQKSERILAAAPNNESTSLEYHDRGDRGSTAVTRVPGNYETPGPQNVTSVNRLLQRDMLPGMGGYGSPKDMLPGMGNYGSPKDMLPGMGNYGSPKDMLPGMGEEDGAPASGGTLKRFLPLVLIGGGLAFLLMRSK